MVSPRLTTDSLEVRMLKEISQQLDRLIKLTGTSSANTVLTDGTQETQIVDNTGVNIDLATDTTLSSVNEATEIIQGRDFLCITDTAAHGSLDCTMIYVMADAVFTSITVAGSSVAAKGLTAITVVAGTMLPFGKVHATAIQLASGSIIAYIN